MSFFLAIRRYAPFATFSGGFEGDMRTGGSVSPTATARTAGIVTFDRIGVQGYIGYSSGSTFEGAGQWISKIIGRHYSQVKAETSQEDIQTGQISFTVHTAGANPLVPIVAPDIDTFLDFTAAFTESAISVSGQVRGDTFPNAEIVLLDESLQGALLFDYRTSGGRETGPLSLFGDHAEEILGGFTTSLALSGSVFAAPNPSCPVSRQTTAAANANWSGGGGRSGGGGASGRW
jgi:hypothetical protein